MPSIDPSIPVAAVRGFGGGAVESVLLVFIAVIAAATVIAGIELAVRSARERSRRAGGDPVLTALLAQRLYARVLYGVAPAVVASVVVLLRTESVSSAAFLLVVMGLTAGVLRGR